MDGFKSPNNPSEQVRVIVIAATNRRSILDPAILRPGRFDRHVVIPPHARNVRMSNAVDLVFFADDSMTKIFTGADLKNVINEAALLTPVSYAVSSQSILLFLHRSQYELPVIYLSYNLLLTSNHIRIYHHILLFTR